MNSSKRFISPALFVLILICFTLPFVTVSCGSLEETITGFQLATGTTLETEADLYPVDPQPLAIIALIVGVMGLILGLWWSKKSQIISAILAIAGFLSVLALRLKISHSVYQDAAREGMEGIVKAEFGSGFYIPLILFLFAAGINVMFYSGDKSTMFQGLVVAKSHDYRFCTHCGAKAEGRQEFCSECGSKLEA
ncbi:MAG: zinc-ribbon domain-containing protein [Bacillota bacterium]